MGWVSANVAASWRTRAGTSEGDGVPQSYGIYSRKEN